MYNSNNQSSINISELRGRCLIFVEIILTWSSGLRQRLTVTDLAMFRIVFHKNFFQTAQDAKEKQIYWTSVPWKWHGCGRRDAHREIRKDMEIGCWWEEESWETSTKALLGPSNTAPSLRVYQPEHLVKHCVLNVCINCHSFPKLIHTIKNYKHISPAVHQLHLCS